jgi:hypothetical protein
LAAGVLSCTSTATALMKSKTMAAETMRRSIVNAELWSELNER